MPGHHTWSACASHGNGADMDVLKRAFIEMSVDNDVVHTLTQLLFDLILCQRHILFRFFISGRTCPNDSTCSRPYPSMFTTRLQYPLLYYADGYLHTIVDSS